LGDEDAGLTLEILVRARFEQGGFLYPRYLPRKPEEAKPWLSACLDLHGDRAVVETEFRSPWWAALDNGVLPSWSGQVRIGSVLQKEFELFGFYYCKCNAIPRAKECRNIGREYIAHWDPHGRPATIPSPRSGQIQ